MEAITFESASTFLNQGWVGSVIGLTGILIGAIISAVFFFRSKRRAKPSAQFSRMTIISPQSDELPSDVEILYKGSKIEQLSKTNVIFWNSGTETLHGYSVVEDDPVQICFEEGVTVLRHQIIKETRNVNSARLEPVENRQNAINVKFDYLDPNDGINIEILHDSKSEPRIIGSIRGLPSGIKVVNKLPSIRLLPASVIKFIDAKADMIGMVSLVIAGIMSFLVSGVSGLSSSHRGDIDFSFIVMGCGYLLLPLGFFWFSRKRYPKELSE